MSGMLILPISRELLNTPSVEIWQVPWNPKNRNVLVSVLVIFQFVHSKPIKSLSVPVSNSLPIEIYAWFFKNNVKDNPECK